MDHQSYRNMDFNNYYPPAQPCQPAPGPPGPPPPGPPHGHLQGNFMAPASAAQTHPNAHFSHPPNHQQQHSRHQHPPMIHHQELAGQSMVPPGQMGMSPHQLPPMHHHSPAPAPLTHTNQPIGPPPHPMPSMHPFQAQQQPQPQPTAPPQHNHPTSVQSHNHHQQLPNLSQPQPHTSPAHYISAPPVINRQQQPQHHHPQQHPHPHQHPQPQQQPQPHPHVQPHPPPPSQQQQPQMHPQQAQHQQQHPHQHSLPHPNQHPHPAQHPQQQPQPHPFPHPVPHQHQQLPPAPPPPSHHHLHQGPPVIERVSPFQQNIPQTEFRIMEVNKRLQTRPRSRMPESALPNYDFSDESLWWHKFASDFFDDDSMLALRVILDDKPIEFTIGRTLIPKFFRTYFDGGVVDLSIKLRNSREIAHPSLITLECDQTDITTKNVFVHNPTQTTVNAVVHTEGHLSLDFLSDSLLIKTWRFSTTQCHEYIDRAVTSNGLPSTFLVDSVTKHGLTTKTLSYLKMCQIFEPMQVLMSMHKQTKMDPRACLKHLLHDKYKIKSIEDNRAQPSKRRKRKAPNTVAGATGTTKKSKANANNANMMSNNTNNNNNTSINKNGNMISNPPLASGPPNLALASQDAMVVGEPTMLGIDFGDENERRITRLENNQFDAMINTNSNNPNNNNIAINQSPNCNNMNPQSQDQNKGNNDSNSSNNNNLVHHMQQQPIKDINGLDMIGTGCPSNAIARSATS